MTAIIIGLLTLIGSIVANVIDNIILVRYKHIIDIRRSTGSRKDIQPFTVLLF